MKRQRKFPWEHRLVWNGKTKHTCTKVHYFANYGRNRFCYLFSALHFMWLPRDSKADNVRCYYNLRHQTLMFCYPVSQQSRDVNPGNRFFQIASYEPAYVRITWKNEKKKSLRSLCVLKCENTTYKMKRSIEQMQSPRSRIGSVNASHFLLFCFCLSLPVSGFLTQ